MAKKTKEQLAAWAFMPTAAEVAAQRRGVSATGTPPSTIPQATKTAPVVDQGSAKKQKLAAWAFLPTAGEVAQARAEVRARVAPKTTQADYLPSADQQRRERYAAAHPEETGGYQGQKRREQRTREVYQSAAQTRQGDGMRFLSAKAKEGSLSQQYEMLRAGAEQGTERWEQLGKTLSGLKTDYQKAPSESILKQINEVIAEMEAIGEIQTRWQEMNTTQGLQKIVDEVQGQYDAAKKRPVSIPADAFMASETPSYQLAPGMAVRDKQAAGEDLKSWKELLGSAKELEETLALEEELLAPVSTPQWDRLIRDKYAKADENGVVSEEEVRSKKIKLAKGMLQVEVEKARAEMDAASKKLTAHDYGVRYQEDGTQASRDELDAAYQAAKAEYDELAYRLSKLSQLDYTSRNESEMERKKADPVADVTYKATAMTRDDQGKLQELLKYYSSPSGYTAEEVETMLGYEEELGRKYSLTHQDFVNYITAGEVPKTIRATDETMTRRVEEGRETLEEGQYDFWDLYGYEQRVQRQREMARQLEREKEAARALPILSSLGSVLATPLQVFDLVNYDPGRGKPGDVGYVPPDTSAMALTNTINTIRGTISQDLERSTDWEIFGVNVASFLYQTGMSTLDSAASVAALGPGSVYLMGANAAVNGVREIVQRGGTAEQAFWGGLAAGAAEMLFEKVSIDNLLKPKNIDSVRRLVLETLKQGGIEASEEMCTEIANIISDAAIMGANSNYAQAVAAYREQGMSQSQAQTQVFVDLIGQVVEAGVGGAFSGMAMGGVHGTMQYLPTAGQSTMPRAGQLTSNQNVAAELAMPRVGQVTMDGGQALNRAGEGPEGQARVGTQQDTASTGEAGLQSGEDQENNSWNVRTYTMDGRTFVQSKDMQRMYEVPHKGEVHFTVDGSGTVTLDDDIVSRIDRKDYRDFIKAYAMTNLVTKVDQKTGAEIDPKPITIKSDGSRIIITQTGINEFAKKIHGAGIKDHDNVSSVLLLDHIIENAVNAQPRENKHGRSVPYTDYESRFSVGGRTYQVTINVKNAEQGSRYHYHALNEIEVVPIDGSNGASTETYLMETTSKDSIPQRGQSVKGDMLPKAQADTLPTASESTLPRAGETQTAAETDMGETMSEESWQSLMETQYPSMEPLGDDYLEALMTQGEDGYVPRETRTAQEMAWDQDLAETPEAVQKHLKPTAEEVEGAQWAETMEKAVQRLVRDYGSKADAGELARGLQAIFDEMGSEDGLSGREVAQRTQALARELLGQAEVTNDELYRDSKEARDLIRGSTIYITPEAALDIPGYNDFKKRYFGSMNLSTTQGRSIDDLFKELANYDVGGYFRDQMLAPSDQLLQIARFLDETRPQMENPYAAVMDEASTALGQELAEVLDRLHSRRNTLRRMGETRRASESFWEGAGTSPSVANILTELPETKKDPVKRRAAEAWRTFYRAMVDSGETVDTIGRKTKDALLYSYYNFARASGSAGQTMIQKGGYQADIAGNRVGPSLGDIFSPIRSKGDDYYRDFQAYLFHLHNMDRMSLASSAAVDIAAANFEEFKQSHPELAQMAETDLLDAARSGLGADVGYDAEIREYVRLEREYNKAKQRKNKPVFGEDVDAARSQEEADRLLAAHPEFRELAQPVYDYANNLLQYRVDSGLLSQEQMEAIQKLYPHYVPTFRVTDTNARELMQAGIKISKGIGTAVGGSADLLPLHIAMARQTMQVVKNGSTNRFATRLLGDYYGNKKALGDYIYKVEKVDGEDGLDEFERIMWTRDQAAELEKSKKRDIVDFDQGEGRNKDLRTVTLYEDGQQLKLTVDQGLMEAMEALAWHEPGTQTVDKLDRLLKGVEKFYNRPFKMLTTGLNPVFIGKNLIRDFQEAVFYSDYRGTWARKYLGAFSKILNNDAMWQQYKALGGVYASYLDYNKGYSEGPTSKAGEVIERLEAINEAIEQAPRFAEFMAHVEKNGADMDSLMEAMHAAANITVNFGRSGEVGGLLNRTIAPYLNAAIQGTDKLVKTFVGAKDLKRILHLAAGILLVCAVPRTIDEILCHDAPGWEDIPESVKNAYWLIHIGDGKYLRLPKANGTSVPDMVLATAGKAAMGQDVDWLETAGDAANQTLPDNFLNTNIFTSLMNVALFDPKNPGKTWYGGDIESQRLQSLPTAQRYDENTDYLSRGIGALTGLSPKKINYILDQSTGVVGDIFLPMATPAGDKAPLAIFKKGFTYDSVTQNRLGGDFYDAKDRVTWEKNAGKPEQGATLRWLNKKSGEISELYAKIREVQNAGLPNSEMLKQVRELRRQINEIERDTLDTLPTYIEVAAKHYTGEGDEAVDRAFRAANRELFGAESALEDEGKTVYLKAKGAHALGASYEGYYDAYEAMKGVDTKRERQQALEKAGLSDADRNAVYAVGDGKSRYDKLLSYGLPSKSAQKVTWAVENILPQAGRESATDAQKWRAVVNCGLSDDETMKGLRAVMDKGQYGKLTAARECKVSTKEYVAFKEAMEQEEKQTQAVAERVLEGIAMEDSSRAVLWQLHNKSWDPWNNPFDRTMGRKAAEIMGW